MKETNKKKVLLLTTLRVTGCIPGDMFQSLINEAWGLFYPPRSAKPQINLAFIFYFELSLN